MLQSNRCLSNRLLCLACILLAALMLLGAVSSLSIQEQGYNMTRKEKSWVNRSIRDRSVHMVISSYNENMTHIDAYWIKKYNYTLYRKGKDAIDPSFNPVMMDENVGRETYVYLTHIVKHYDALPEITIFTQAGELRGNNNGSIVNKIVDIFEGRLRFYKKNSGFAFLDWPCFNSGAGLHEKKIPHPYAAEDLYRHSFHMRKREWTIGEVYKELFKVPQLPVNPRYARKGIIAVTRRAIHRLSREHYQSLLNLTDLATANNPSIGFVFETNWPAVFHSNCTSSLNEEFYCVLKRNKDDKWPVCGDYMHPSRSLLPTMEPTTPDKFRFILATARPVASPTLRPTKLPTIPPTIQSTNLTANMVQALPTPTITKPLDGSITKASTEPQSRSSSGQLPTPAVVAKKKYKIQAVLRPPK